MLNSHLISIQNVYKLTLLAALLVSCSTNNQVKKGHSRVESSKSDCSNDSENWDKKFLTISARHHSKQLSHCFQNYIRFETNKKQTIKTCNILGVNRSGKVTYVYSRGMKGTIIPKDLKMCMEQDFWKMHFKGLQLEKGYTIKFPLGFKSI